MRTIKTQAIILRRTDFREADRIVNLLTPEGKLSAIARGVRKQKSKLAGGVEFFSVNEVVLGEGKSDMKTIVSARMKDFYGEILKDFDRTDFAYQAIKIINRKCENVDSPDFFDVLKQTFVALSNLDISFELVKSWFYLKTALISGEEVNLHSDSNGYSLKSAQLYDFDSYDKVFVATDNGRFNENHIKFLRIMVSSEPQIISKIVGVNELNMQVQDIIYSLGGI